MAEHAAIGRRVADRVRGDYGTVVATSGGRYQVAWDTPTPCQATARVSIPSEFFEWAARLNREGA